MGFLDTYRIEIEEFLRETGYFAVQRETEETGRIQQLPILAWTQAGHWRECAHSQQDGEELYCKRMFSSFFVILREPKDLLDSHEILA